MAQIRMVRSQSQDFSFDECTFDIVVFEHYVFFQAFDRVIVIGTFEFSQQHLNDKSQKTRYYTYSVLLILFYLYAYAPCHLSTAGLATITVYLHNMLKTNFSRAFNRFKGKKYNGFAAGPDKTTKLPSLFWWAGLHFSRS